jgi:tetratricopeptide (TPR) repeat protein
MPKTARVATVFASILLGAFGQAVGQHRVDDPPAVVQPAPLTKEAGARREALKLFVQGLLSERADRMLEATRMLEEAVQLEPGAAAIYKALLPLYLTLERGADALAMSRKVLELDPNDAPIWYVLARQLRARGQLKEAAEALSKGRACPCLRDAPELMVQFHCDLGAVHERLQAFPAAAQALTQAGDLIEQHLTATDAGASGRDELMLRAAETYERLGSVLLQMKQYDAADDAYRKAQTKYPDGAGRLNLNLAQVNQQRGKLAEALRHIDAYLRLQPQGIEAYELKRSLLHGAGRDQEVLPWLEEAAAKDRFNVGLKLLLARQYVEARQPLDAEKLYLHLAEQSPTIDVYRCLFTLYKDESGLGMIKGLKLLDQMMASAINKPEASPSNPAPAHARAMINVLRSEGSLAKELVWIALPLIDQKTNLHPDTLHVLAALADRNRQTVAAEKLYRHCLKQATLQTEPLVYGGLLNVLWRARKYDAVVEVCRHGLKTAKASQHVFLHSELARALARVGRVDDALAAADQAFKLADEPHRLPIQLLRLRILTQAGRTLQAEKECLALLEEQKLSTAILETRYLLSHIYSHVRQFARAQEQLELCLKLDPNNAGVHNDLGYLWADQDKNLREAEELIRRALELDRQRKRGLMPPGVEPERDDKDSAAFVDSLGWVLYRQGQLDAARQELERAAELPDGDDPVIWDHLGDVYLRLERRAEAQRAWQRAQHLYELDQRHKIDPRYQTLREKLRQLAITKSVREK